jgi:hypothetical protein
MKTYETRGRGVVDPPPRRGNFTSHPPAGVMRLPREWRRTSVESFSDDGRYVEYRFVVLQMASVNAKCLYHLGDPGPDPVQLSMLKSLARAQGVVRGVYPGDALATLKLLGQEGRATSIHVEVMWTRESRGEVSAALGIDRIWELEE